MQNETKFKIGDIVFIQNVFTGKMELPCTITKNQNGLITLQLAQTGEIIHSIDSKFAQQINIGDQLLIDESFLLSEIWKKHVDYVQQDPNSDKIIHIDKHIERISNKEISTLDSIYLDKSRFSDITKSVIEDDDLPLVKVAFQTLKFLITPLRYIRMATPASVEPTCTCPTLDLMRWGHNKGCHLYKESSR